MIGVTSAGGEAIGFVNVAAALLIIAMIAARGPRRRRVRGRRSRSIVD